MNDPADDSPAPVPSLPCATIVYRLLLKRDWIDPDTGAPQPAAFYRRTRPDGQPAEEGLSVFLAEKCSVDEARFKMDRVRGVASLHVGRIRDLPEHLDVFADADDEQHAEIRGMPTPVEDLDRARRIALLLAEQARRIWPT